MSPLFSLTKMSSFSSRSWAHEVIRKRNIERSAFHERGFRCSCRVAFRAMFGRWSDRDETVSCVFLQHHSWDGLYLWELRGVGRIFGLVPAVANEREKKVILWSYSSFFVSFRGGLYICPRFCFLFSVFFYLFSLSLLWSGSSAGTVYIWRFLTVQRCRVVGNDMIKVAGWFLGSHKAFVPGFCNWEQRLWLLLAGNTALQRLRSCGRRAAQMRIHDVQTIVSVFVA